MNNIKRFYTNLLFKDFSYNYYNYYLFFYLINI